MLVRKLLFSYQIRHILLDFTILLKQLNFNSIERTCPDDCTDKSQGTCDTSTGTCTCEQGFDGINCAGKKTAIFISNKRFSA